MSKTLIGIFLLLVFPLVTIADTVAEKLQSVSVTIKAGGSEGSGVIVKRGEYNFVLTAGHVVSSLRKTRSVIDSGMDRTVVEFNDASIIQNVYEDGRKVGQVEMTAKVISYSNADSGEDLALLQIIKKNFATESATFYLSNDIPKIGTRLYHVGSLRGEFGSNSLTNGIINSIGRIYDGKIYDQTSCTALPGSSGGGIFLEENGEYVGMLVRGGGETFNLIIPIRRIREWTNRMGLNFVIDPNVAVPSDEEIRKILIEDIGANNWNKAKVSIPSPILSPEPKNQCGNSVDTMQSNGPLNVYLENMLLQYGAAFNLPYAVY
jgi:hypothetical protein